MMNEHCECGIIQDLLPLYLDHVCSEESKQLVEQHLKNCPVCQAITEQIKKTEIDESLKTETENVVTRHNKKLKERILEKAVYIDAIVNVLLILGSIRGIWAAMIFQPFLLLMFLIWEIVYIVLRHMKKIPFISEKIAYVSIFIKIIIMAALLFAGAIVGFSEIASILSESAAR